MSGAPTIPPRIRSAFPREEGLARLLAVLNPPGGAGETRFVGGAVRDALLGLSVGDIDCATVLRPEEVTRRCEQAGFRVVPTGVEFGTVTVVVDHRGVEVTTLRRDVATDGRRAVVAFGTDWAEDARRRDFTLNALYCDPDGTVHDPLGGYPDLIAHRVRFIGDPDTRLREDYLRLLRFFRFHAQYGAGPLDEAGFRAAIRNRRSLSRLSAERIAREFARLLEAPRAAETLTALAETGLLIDLVGVPRLARFARLKAIETTCGIGGRYERGLAALAVHHADDADRLSLLVPGRKKAARTLLALAGRHARHLAADPSARTGRQVLELARRDFADVALIAWAEAGAAADDERFSALLDLPRTNPIPPFPLRGADLLALGATQGPGMGQLIEAARRVWRASDYREGREALLARLRQGCGSGDLP